MNELACNKKLKMSFGKIRSWVGIPVSEMKMTLMRNEIDEMFNLQKYEDSTQTI